MKMTKRIKTALTAATTYATTAMFALNASTAYASANAQSLMKEAISLIAKILIAPAIILVVMGVIHYATAMSEGDGPAKQKATMQIAAGVAIALVSAVLISMAETFAKLVTV